MTLHGILVIDKGPGLTSHDVVAWVRRITGERKVGHTGTLDPLATGVLPVCLGAATKVIEYLVADDKAYEAEVVLGAETDTDDAEGRVVREAPVPTLTAADLDQTLAPFRGDIVQIPPMYAAIKVGGRKLYELARAGETVERAPRAVRIDRLDLLDWQSPVARLRIDCSKGTYIRALARDLGRALGCGGHLRSLRRLRSGSFTIDRAIALEWLGHEFGVTPWERLTVPLEVALPGWPSIALDEGGVTAWRQGRPVRARRSGPGERCLAYGPDGAWLGLGRYDARSDTWHPEKVVAL